MLLDIFAHGAILLDIPPTITTATPGVSTSTSAVISWNQQAYVNIYEVSFERATGDQQFGDCPAYEHRGRVLVAGATTTHILTGLQEFSTYFITVTAVNAAGRNASAPVTVNTIMAGMEHLNCMCTYCNSNSEQVCILTSTQSSQSGPSVTWNSRNHFHQRCCSMGYCCVH